MSDEKGVAGDVPLMDDAREEGHSYRLHSGNSQVTPGNYSGADSYLEERNVEFQHSPERQSEPRGRKSRAGVFSRLRKKLSFRSVQIPVARSSSSVRVTPVDSVDVGGSSPIIVHKERTPRYQCVPTPPGCIPTEMMLKVEDENQPFNLEILKGSELGKTIIDGVTHAGKVCRNNKESVQDENGDLASNSCIYEDSKPPKVSYNNWVDPEL